MVSHGRCGMPVGTDGVLIGAWADMDACQTILDVGTGSGLIALMTAQRYIHATITAIDTHADAVEEAAENIEKSSFKERVSVHKSSFQDFVRDTNQRFEAIVSNPPFFTHGLLSPDSARADARHTQLLTSGEIFQHARKILHPIGRLAFIYPFSEKARIMQQASDEKFFLCRETIVYPTPKSLPKRVLFEFRLQKPNKIISDTLIIEVERHRYSPEFEKLVKDFYLNL